MKKLKNLFFLSALLWMVACQSHEEIEMPPVADGNNAPLSEVRSAEDAIDIANKVMELLANTPEQTRNLGVRKVKSVSCVGNHAATRAEEQDSLLYLINYDDELGFAVISRSTSARPVYAFSDSGNLSMADTIDNKGLAMFFEDTFNTLGLNPGGDLFPVVPDPLYIANQVDPLLNENVAKWNQRYPFNQSTPVSNGSHGVVGCGPVAMGMLLTHYEYPASIGSLTVNWDNLKNNNYIHISQYLEALAKSPYLEAKYSDDTFDSRYIELDSIKSTFKKLGFGTDNMWKHAKFLDNRRTLYSFMKMGYRVGTTWYMSAPVIFYGSRTYIENGITKASAHVWIVDGYLDMASRYGFDLETSERDPYLHCVWGWGGKANGYFLYSRVNDKGSSTGKDGEEPPYVYEKYKMYGRLLVPTSN